MLRSRHCDAGARGRTTFTKLGPDSPVQEGCTPGKGVGRAADVGAQVGLPGTPRKLLGWVRAGQYDGVYSGLVMICRTGLFVNVTGEEYGSVVFAICSSRAMR